VSTFGNASAVKLEPMLKTTNLRSAMTQTFSASAPLFTATIYVAAFTTGAIVMSFEMLGSRYLNASIPGRRSSQPSWRHLPPAISSAASSPIARYRRPSSASSSSSPRFIYWHCRFLLKAF